MGENHRGPVLNALLDPVEAVLDLLEVDLGKPGEGFVELRFVLLEELRGRGGELKLLPRLHLLALAALIGRDAG